MVKNINIDFPDNFNPPSEFNNELCKECPLCYEFEDDYGRIIKECSLIEYEHRKVYALARRCNIENVGAYLKLDCPIKKYFN